MTLLAATERDVARFMSYVRVLPCGCWFWTGGRSRGSGNTQWYGSFWLPGHGTVRAHRFSCDVIAEKECPSGYHRDHLCEFTLCVNPACIEIVTHEENERRKQERRRRVADTYSEELERVLQCVRGG